MSYRITTKPDGRGGWAFYEEDRVALPIPWEVSSIGISIYIPSTSEWRSLCENHGAGWAREREDEILQRVAEGVKKDRHLKGEIEKSDSWLHIYSRKTV